MNYKEISDRWKMFLTENTFKEDVIFNPDEESEKIGKKRKKKSNKKVGPPPKKAKEIIVSEKEKCMEEGFDCMEEWDELEEQSTMSSGAVEGAAGKSPFISEEEYNDNWGLTRK